MAVTELTNLRNRTTKVFDLGNGQRRYRCSTDHLHYLYSGAYRDINTSLVNGGSGKLQQADGAYHSSLPALANGVFEFYNQGDHRFDLRLIDALSVGHQPIPDGRWGNNQKAIQYKDAFGSGIHFEVIGQNRTFLKYIRFDVPPPDTTQDFILKYEIVQMPSVFEYRSHINGISTTIDKAGKFADALRLDNKIISMHNGGAVRTYISFPKCYDSGDIRKELPVKIVILTDAGKTYLWKIIPKEIFKNAVYPVFADDPANYVGSTGDAALDTGLQVDWDTAHDATTGTVVTANPHELRILAGASDRRIFRIATPVDTSGIADGDTITAVVYHVTGSGSMTGLSGEYVQVVGGTFNDPVVAGDMDLVGDAVDNPTLHHDGNGIETTAWNNAGDNNWTYNAAGIATVSKTGITNVGLRLLNDNIDNDISSNPKVKHDNSSQSGTEPYLDVTTSSGGGDVRRHIIPAYMRMNN